MTIPFRVKLLTSTAKPPHRNCESDLWDLFADDFDFSNSKHNPNYGFMGELADFEIRNKTQCTNA